MGVARLPYSTLAECVLIFQLVCSCVSFRTAGRRLETSAHSIDDQDTNASSGVSAATSDEPQALFLLGTAQSEFDVASYWSRGFSGKSHVDSPLTSDGVRHAQDFARQVQKQVHLANAPPPDSLDPYTAHPGKNCMPRFGAKSGDFMPVREQLTLDACKDRCDIDEKCNCITFVEDGGKCWKRTDCDPQHCDNSDDHSTHTLQPKRPETDTLSHPPSEITDVAKADCIFSSPLTRALETCLVGLRPLLERKIDAPSKIVLIPDLTDRTNAVHYDSIGDSQLDEIKSKAIRELMEVFDEDSDELKSAMSIQVESSQAIGAWWATEKESDVEIGLRVSNFFRKVQSGEFTNAQGARCRRVFACTHSSVIGPAMQMFWRHRGVESYIPPWFHGQTQEWVKSVGHDNQASALPASDLTDDKLAELGLVSMRLDTGDGGRADVAQPRLLFDTRILDAKEKPCGGENDPGKRLNEEGKGDAWGKPFCACRWGYTCQSSSNKCAEGLSAWPYPSPTNVFQKDCNDCQCVKL